MYSTTAQKPSRSFAVVLTGLAFLFFLRVLAQALAAFFAISFLPSMDEWVIPSASPFSTSGYIPYPILLPIQVIILVLQFVVCRDFLQGHGYFVSLKSKTAWVLIWLAYIYFTSMVLRYIITMALYPERRWFGHTVPILLHFVLAAFLFTLGRYNDRPGAVSNRSQ
jgi:hypothetical protein